MLPYEAVLISTMLKVMMEIKTYVCIESMHTGRVFLSPVGTYLESVVIQHMSI